MTDLELGRRERKKEETRLRLVNAALESFRQKGFEATTVDDIAERADVAKGTFFNYFPRKEAILDDVHDLQIQEIEAASGPILESGRSVREMMSEVQKRACEVYARDRDVSRAAILNVLKNPPGVSPNTAEMQEHVQGLVRRFVQKGVATGELRANLDIERATYILRGNFFFTILMWLCCPEPPYDLQGEMEARLRLILEGLAPTKGGAR